jgi:hypothetical protein
MLNPETIGLIGFALVVLLIASRVPIGMAMAIATMMLMTPNWMVIGSFSRMSWVTGWRVRMDSPRSPCTTCKSQAPYCTGTGSLRRYLSRMYSST